VGGDPVTNNPSLQKFGGLKVRGYGGRKSPPGGWPTGFPRGSRSRGQAKSITTLLNIFP